MKKYRLYIDESGTHNYSLSDDMGKRYLALMGVICSEEEYIEKIQPKIREMKQLVADDPDDLPVLHREDIVSQKGCFRKLADNDTKKKYNSVFIELLEKPEYCIVCVVLDKKSHLAKYDKAAFHPYHYCLSVLLERYVFYLEENNGKGDVIAEARGKEEDKMLKEEYNNFYDRGTYFKRASSIQQRLTSKEIKIKPKTANIEGLEFADLLSLAGKLDTLVSNGAIRPLADNFCKIIVEKISKKYRCGSAGKANGFGKKLIK